MVRHLNEQPRPGVVILDGDAVAEEIARMARDPKNARRNAFRMKVSALHRREVVEGLRDRGWR